MSKKNEKGTFVCPDVLCAKQYSYYEAMRRHYKKVHENDDPFRCDVCGRRFAATEELKLHEARHGGEKIFKCDFPGCGKSYEFKSALVNHKRRHQHPCDALGCLQVFETYSMLRKHRAECHKADFVCSQCGKAFTQESNYRIHARVHEEASSELFCPEPGCDRRYKYKKNLTQHLRLAHSEKKEKFQCEFCERSLSTKQKLDQHVGSFHSPDNPKPLPVKGARELRKQKAGHRSVVAILSGVTPSSTIPKEVLESTLATESENAKNAPDDCPVISCVLSSGVKRTEVALSSRPAEVKAIVGSPVLMSVNKRRKKRMAMEAGENEPALKAWQGVFREK